MSKNLRTSKKGHGKFIVTTDQGEYIAYHLDKQIKDGLINSAKEQYNCFLKLANEFVKFTGKGKIVERIPPATLSDFMKRHNMKPYSKVGRGFSNAKPLSAISKQLENIYVVEESTQYYSEATEKDQGWNAPIHFYEETAVNMNLAPSFSYEPFWLENEAKGNIQTNTSDEKNSYSYEHQTNTFEEILNFESSF